MVSFSTSQYQFSHGKMPRGTGMWAFEFAGVTVFAPGTMSFAEAKKWATAEAKTRGVSTVKVMP